MSVNDWIKRFYEDDRIKALNQDLQQSMARLIEEYRENELYQQYVDDLQTMISDSGKAVDEAAK